MMQQDIEDLENCLLPRSKLLKPTETYAASSEVWCHPYELHQAERSVTCIILNNSLFEEETSKADLLHKEICDLLTTERTTLNEIASRR